MSRSKKTDVISTAMRIAASAHERQTDKVGRPYVYHPLRIAMRLEQAGHGPYAIAVGLLHDVVEDCEDWTLERLTEEGLPEEVVTAVWAITHPKHEPYKVYLERVAANPLAATVKRQDVLDNLSPLRMHGASPEDRIRLTKKYHLALDVLGVSEAA